MLLRTTARDLLLATWTVAPARLGPGLPAAVEPAVTEEGEALVSLAALRHEAVRAGRLRVPSFAQLTVRTYVTAAGRPCVFLLGVRVTPPALAGALFGIPLRPARIAVAPGRAEAPGLGAYFRYRVVGSARKVPVAGETPLGVHDVAAFYSAGLRLLAGRHRPPEWQEAELLEPARVEPVQAFGFDVREPASLLYADGVDFEVDLPPAKVADSSP
jgi:hypothetical protein